MVLQLSFGLILIVGGMPGRGGKRQEYVPTVETLAVLGMGNGKHCVLHIVF